MTEPMNPADEHAKAEARFKAAEGRWATIRALVGPLLEARQENHFAERLRVAMTPKGKK